MLFVAFTALPAIDLDPKGRDFEHSEFGIFSVIAKQGGVTVCIKPQNQRKRISI